MSFAFTATWRICPECGGGDGSDHLPSCNKGKRPPKHDYSGEPRTAPPGMDGTLNRPALRAAMENYQRETE